MKTMTYSESRARYAEVLDQVVNDREEIIITRQGHESAVIMALDEYESLMETVYLMQSPANARHLRESIARHRAGEGVVHDLVDLDKNCPCTSHGTRKPGTTMSGGSSRIARPSNASTHSSRTSSATGTRALANLNPSATSSQGTGRAGSTHVTA